jgi:hypothetical protein
MRAHQLFRRPKSELERSVQIFELHRRPLGFPETNLLLLAHSNWCHAFYVNEWIGVERLKWRKESKTFSERCCRLSHGPSFCFDWLTAGYLFSSIVAQAAANSYVCPCPNLLLCKLAVLFGLAFFASWGCHSIRRLRQAAQSCLEAGYAKRGQFGK